MLTVLLSFAALALLAASPFLVAVWRERTGRMPQPPTPPGPAPQ
ncbi:hypothetical protein [Streptomyces sp. CS090A]|nr:hypothetical protein [Streptomyces sp. CS090A]